jgi:hypothetical protein
MGNIGVDMAWFHSPNLSYDHRKEADEALRGLMSEQLSNHPSAINISEVFKIIKKNLNKIVKDKGLTLSDFVEYLLDKVVIMRIPVPQDTELNHYFEIMNSRGEQLEKHEVLKASLMNYLEPNASTLYLFDDIWEACSDMSTYVQMKMKPALRSLVFSNEWNSLQYTDFDTLLQDYADIDSKSEEDSDEDEHQSRSLAELFEDAKNNVKYDLPDSDENSNGGNDRFGSIINFPNFLLHVLKVQYNDERESYQAEIDEELNLDDKRLLDIFRRVLSASGDKRAFVKRYIMNLLRMRNLFDMYVIKRENYNNKEGWSLKKLKKYDRSKVNYVGSFSNKDSEDDISKDIRMLEAMFHVSAPTQIYKHWLNAILKYLNDQEVVAPNEMRQMLYRLACAYMLDRYLVDDEHKIDFEDIIYRNDFTPTNHTPQWDAIDNGCDVENFVFNFYDYIVWKQDVRKYAYFEFSYRTSVEHFYPQHPLNGNKPLVSQILNSFGNLCLISRGMNSKFSNNMPEAKCKNFGNMEAIKSLSIKLIEMMDVVKAKNEWGVEQIEAFEQQSKERLIKALQKVL